MSRIASRDAYSTGFFERTNRQYWRGIYWSWWCDADRRTAL